MLEDTIFNLHPEQTALLRYFIYTELKKKSKNHDHSIRCYICKKNCFKIIGGREGGEESEIFAQEINPHRANKSFVINNKSYFKKILLYEIKDKLSDEKFMFQNNYKHSFQFLQKNTTK